MKKLIVILLLFCTSFITNAEMKNVGFSAGVSSIFVNGMSSIGYNVGFMFNNVYMDAVSNLTSYSGTYQKFTTPFLYTQTRSVVNGINVGYEFSFLGSKHLHFIPTVGYYHSNNIHESNNTYFIDNKNYVKLGIHCKYYLSDHVGLMLGTNNIERLKFSLCYKF